MSQEKELIARGAECVTGDLMIGQKVVGHYNNGVFVITPDGEAELQITDVVAARPLRTHPAVRSLAASTA
jgi:hypothetical protein